MWTPEQSAAYIMSQTVACMVEMEGMKAENKCCGNLPGGGVTYGEKDFLKLLEKYPLRDDLVCYTLAHGERAI